MDQRSENTCCRTIDKVGSSANSHVAATFILDDVFRHPRSLSFRKPVNPHALGIFPVYNQIVKHPMDLGTIKSRIDAGLYTNKDDLIADIQLVWNNAKKFNPNGRKVYDRKVYEAAEYLEIFSLRE